MPSSEPVFFFFLSLHEFEAFPELIPRSDSTVCYHLCPSNIGQADLAQWGVALLISENDRLEKLQTHHHASNLLCFFPS